MTLDAIDQSSLSRTIAIIRQIWAEILKISEDEIGEHDNFFALGGSSVQAFMVNAQIEEVFAARLPADGIPISAIVDEPDMASFSARLEHVMASSGEEITAAHTQGFEEGSI